jgi:amino acid transporter
MSNSAHDVAAGDASIDSRVLTDGVEVELKRDLGLFDITMIGIGAMIGAGIFVLLGSAAGVAGPAAILAIVFNGGVTAITALAYAELGSAFPEAGGGYIWAKEGLPPPTGFLSGWMSWVATITACALYAVGFGSFIAFIFTPEVSGISLGIDKFILSKIFAVTILAFFIFVNFWGAKTMGKTEGAITIAKIVVLGIFCVFGIARMIQEPALAGKFISDFMPFGFGGVLLAMGLTFVAFEGYEIIAQSGEEVKNPKKNIPRAIFLSIGVVVVIYVLVFIVAYGITPGFGTVDPELAVIKAGGNVVVGGVVLMLFGGLMATTSALNATIYSSSRVSFSMGRDGSLPNSFGVVHKKRRTPGNAVIISGLVILVMALLLPIEEIAASAGVMFLLLFIIANMSLISLRRKRPDLDRGFKVPLMPVIPLIGISLNLALAVYMWNFPGGAGQVAWYVALFWISAGLIMHYFTGGREAIEEIPEKRVELLDLISTKPKIDIAKYRILVPVLDFVDSALPDFGAMVARKNDGELAIMSVVEVPSTLPLKSVRFADMDDTIKKVQKLSKVGKKRDVDTRVLLKVSHKVSENIIEVMEEEEVDFLALGWRGKHTKRGILGTNLDYIVQRANCDLAVLKTRGLKERPKNILVLSGTGIHPQFAVSIVSMLAKEHNAKVTILAVRKPEESGDAESKQAQKLATVCKDEGVESEVRVIASSAGFGCKPGLEDEEIRFWTCSRQALQGGRHSGTHAEKGHTFRPEVGASNP